MGLPFIKKKKEQVANKGPEMLTLSALPLILTTSTNFDYLVMDGGRGYLLSQARTFFLAYVVSHGPRVAMGPS